MLLQTQSLVQDAVVQCVPPRTLSCTRGQRASKFCALPHPETTRWWKGKKGLRLSAKFSEVAFRPSVGDNAINECVGHGSDST